LSWNGTMLDGARLYAPQDFKLGLLVMGGVAWFGAMASWRTRETHCRNIHKELQ
jgi:hypothetical protein